MVRGMETEAKRVTKEKIQKMDRGTKKDKDLKRVQTMNEAGQ